MILLKTKAEKMKLEASEEELKEKASDNAVTEQDLAKVINLWTGIPTTKIIENDLRKLSTLEEKLKSRIIGQDEAVDAVVRAIKRSRAGIAAKNSASSISERTSFPKYSYAAAETP